MLFDKKFYFFSVKFHVNCRMKGNFLNMEKSLKKTSILMVKSEEKHLNIIWDTGTEMIFQKIVNIRITYEIFHEWKFL